MALADSIIGAESGGDPNATNPNSSASGPGQFIDSTFLDVARKMQPDLAGKSDAEVLALKTDPQFARQATEYYAQQNQANLAKNGLPVTPGNTYLSHFAGPGGAVKILQADPNASVSDILGPKVVAANPFLKDMTAQGLQAWAAKKMGASLPQPGAQNSAPVNSPNPPAAPPAAPPGPPLSLAPPSAAAAPIFPQAPQQAAPQAQSQAAQIPDLQAPPIFYAPRKPVDLSSLRSAFSAPVFPRQG